MARRCLSAVEVKGRARCPERRGQYAVVERGQSESWPDRLRSCRRPRAGFPSCAGAAVVGTLSILTSIAQNGTRGTHCDDQVTDHTGIVREEKVEDPSEDGDRVDVVAEQGQGP